MQISLTNKLNALQLNKKTVSYIFIYDKSPVISTGLLSYINVVVQCEVGKIKEKIKNAILDGIIPNEYEPAFDYMLKVAEKMGLTPKA